MSPQQQRENFLRHYYGYRLYCTPEFWLITYHDKDFVRIMRNTTHKAGFQLLCLEIFFSLLRGVRTDIRDKWAIHARGYEADAKELGLECRAAAGQVVEFEYELFKPRVKENKQ